MQNKDQEAHAEAMRAAFPAAVEECMAKGQKERAEATLYLWDHSAGYRTEHAAASAQIQRLREWLRAQVSK